jgi:hypothetical protein
MSPVGRPWGPASRNQEGINPAKFPILLLTRQKAFRRNFHLIDLTDMLTPSSTLHDGIIISLADLRRVLEELNDIQGRWWLAEPLVLHPSGRSPNAAQLVEVFLCRSGPEQVTDELSFFVPVVAIGAALDGERTLLSFHPEFIEPGVAGLYLEDGRIMSDFIEDWERFWGPLKLAAMRSRGGDPDSPSG